MPPLSETQSKNPIPNLAPNPFVGKVLEETKEAISLTTSGLLGKMKENFDKKDSKIQELRKEVNSFNSHLEDSNKFAIKFMHAYSVILCSLHEKITGTKPKPGEDYKDVFQTLKEEWTSTLLSKWLGKF